MKKQYRLSQGIGISVFVVAGILPAVAYANAMLQNPLKSSATAMAP